MEQQKNSNNKDHLKTVALRPTLVYGEQDLRFFPALMKLGDKLRFIPRIADYGLKQTSYVGELLLLIKKIYDEKREN
jgi:hypothetical protein